MKIKNPCSVDLEKILEGLSFGCSIARACARANVALPSFNALRSKHPKLRAHVNVTRVAGLKLRASRMRERADGLERRAAKIEREGDQLPA